MFYIGLCVGFLLGGLCGFVLMAAVSGARR